MKLISLLLTSIFLYSISAFTQEEDSIANILQKLYLEEIKKDSILNSQAPDFRLEQWILQKNNKVHTLPFDKVYSKKAEITVIDFWFTHCAPCVATIPHLNSLTRKYPKVQFLSITFNSNNEVQEFLKKYDVHYPIGIDENKSVINSFHINFYPTTVIIDNDDTVIWKGHTVDFTEDVLLKSMGLQNSLTVSNSEKKGSDISFSIQPSQMDGNRYCQSYNYDYRIINQTVPEIINHFFSINNSRLLIKNEQIKSNRYDIMFKSDKRTISNENFKDLFKHNLLNELNFSLNEIIKDTVIYELTIVDSVKLNNNRTKKITKNYNTTHTNNGRTIAEAIDLKWLSSIVENNYNLVVEFNNESLAFIDNKYNFEFEAFDKENALTTFEEQYGIVFLKKEAKTNFWNLEVE